MSMKAIRDVYKKVNSITPAAHTATTNGSVIDLANANENEIVFQLGAWTDGTHTPKLQEGNAANLSDAADVAAADLVGAFAAVSSNANPGTFQVVSYIGSKRYVRVVVTRAGTTTGMVDGAFANVKYRKQP